MPSRSELPLTPPEGIRHSQRRLPVPLSPMKSETLKSYLRRLTDQNLLRPGWLPRLARHRHFVADLVELTGFTERGLVAALPELRTPQAVERWPHLVGHVSKRASTRSACTHCAAAKTHGRTEVVTVFASHEQVICTAHQQWTGSSALRFPVQEQFSVRNCVDVSDAHREHLLLIRRWGRGPVYSCFFAAIRCFTQWSHWPAVSRAPSIQRRRERLDIPDDTPPMIARQAAAWYPSAVALTDLIISLRHDFAKEGRSSAAKIVAMSHIRLRSIFPDLSPSGASDHFRQAILGELDTPPDEVEVAPSNHSRAFQRYRKDDGGNVKPKL